MVENGISNAPRAFNSCAQPRMRSWTSSGATSVRSQASVHLGFAGIRSVAADGLDCFLEALASLLRKTREKKAGMLSWADARDRSSFGDSFFFEGETVRIWIFLRGVSILWFFWVVAGKVGTFFSLYAFLQQVNKTN